MLYQESMFFSGGGSRREACSAEQLLQTIFNNDHEGIIVVNRDGLVSQVNKTLAMAMHLQPQNLIGRPYTELKQGYLRRLAGVLKAGRPEFGKIDSLAGRSVLVDYLPILDNGLVSGALAKVIFLDSGHFLENESGNQGRGRKKNGSRHCGGMHYTVDNITGSSPQMLDLKETLLKVAPRNSNVLITGESGTGKELFAQSVHTASLRRSGPFIKVNCAAIPESLLESEFFGYEEGAFTGSRRGGQEGKLELAHGGTVFLDEIGELPFSLQAKLLRFIQDKEIQKLGSGETIISDVRVVAATNVNLEHLVKYKKFREDLFYRLNVVNLAIPPLRERKEDIPELTEKFIQKFNRLFGFKVNGVSPEVQEVFQRHSWPGNVRELENIIERAFNVLEGNKILLAHLPSHLSSLTDSGRNYIQNDYIPAGNFSAALLAGQSLENIMDQAEKMVILQALMICRGNKAKSAQLLHISRPGLYKKLIKYGLT